MDDSKLNDRRIRHHYYHIIIIIIIITLAARRRRTGETGESPSRRGEAQTNGRSEGVVSGERAEAQTEAGGRNAPTDELRSSTFAAIGRRRTRKIG